MKDKKRDPIETGLVIAVIVATLWAACAITDALRYRREMACRDGWDRGERSAECAEILRKAGPVKTPKGAPAQL